MRTKRIVATLLVALSASACASTFSSIELNEDGTYTLTRIRDGFASRSSKVYRCEESDEGLVCRALH